MSALSFRRLRIRRMPGFPSGGIHLDDLSPGINLVHGPNASGKTTTALALHHLLWHTADHAPSLEGAFDISGVPWTVDVEGRRRTWQRQGQPADPPPLPPAEHRDRYMLSLHQLLVATDSDLAELIHTESAGGYNIRKAAEALDFRSRGWPTRLVTQLRQAEAALEAAKADEQLLARQKATLDELLARHETLRVQAARVEPLRRAHAVAVARERHEDALIALERLPEGIDRLTGNEGSRLDAWRQSDVECDEELATALSELREARQRFDDAGGADGIPEQLIDHLEELKRELVAYEADLADGKLRLAEAREMRRDAERALGAADGREVGDIALPDADRLDALMHTASSLRDRRASLEQRLRLLRTDEEKGEAPEVDARRQQSIHSLRAWLRAAGTDTARDQAHARLLWLAIAAVLATGGAAALLGAPVVLGVAIVAALVLFFMRPAEPADPRPTFRQQAVNSGFAPDAWTVDDVARYLADLETQSARARADETRRAEIARVEGELEAHERDEAAFGQERAAIADAIGLGSHGDLALTLLATRLRVHRDAKTRESAALGDIAAAEYAVAGCVARAGGAAADFGVAIRDAASCSAAITTLRRRRETHTAAVALRRRAEERQAKAEARRQQTTADRASMFAAVGLEAEQEHTLRDRLEQRPAWIMARNRADAAKLALDQALNSFHAVGTEYADLCEQPSAILAAELAAAIAAGDSAGELHREIATIEAELGRARHKRDIEDAVAASIAARSALLDQRDTDTGAAVGAALADWLRANSEEQSRPAVFQRGRELFQDITRHRYQLDISDSEPAEFRAIDTTTERGHSLDELSSGTRVQLLLAMRMAFVETMETAGTRLPLLMDEVLANCDDERASAVIDAAIALAEGGRQLFYFTAQADEHGKWQRALENANVAWAAHGLMRRDGTQPAFDWDMPAHEAVPRPEGRSHAEYGAALGVPPFDPWAPSVKGLHSWYLLDDPDALHALLERGLRTWGQIDNYLGAPGSREDELRPVLEAAARTARLCEAFMHDWRQGRGRPVDAAAITESGAITPTFMDPVLNLCRDVDGDAESLLEGVARLPRFRSANVDLLREYFQENGHIGSGVKLSMDELLGRVQAHATAIAPHLTLRDCQRLIERLAHGSGESAGDLEVARR
jgi:uncharacterized protein YhaN